MVGLEVLYSSFEKIVNNSFTPPNPLSALVGIGSALIMKERLTNVEASFILADAGMNNTYTCA